MKRDKGRKTPASSSGRLLYRKLQHYFLLSFGSFVLMGCFVKRRRVFPAAAALAAAVDATPRPRDSTSSRQRQQQETEADTLASINGDLLGLTFRHIFYNATKIDGCRFGTRPQQRQRVVLPASVLLLLLLL